MARNNGPEAGFVFPMGRSELLEQAERCAAYLLDPELPEGRRIAEYHEVIATTHDGRPIPISSLEGLTAQESVESLTLQPGAALIRLFRMGRKQPGQYGISNGEERRDVLVLPGGKDAGILVHSLKLEPFKSTLPLAETDPVNRQAIVAAHALLSDGSLVFSSAR